MGYCFEEIASIIFTCRKNRILTHRKDTGELENHRYCCVFLKSKN